MKIGCHLSHPESCPLPLQQSLRGCLFCCPAGVQTRLLAYRIAIMLRQTSSSTTFTAAQLHTFEHKYSQVQEATRENDSLVGNQPTTSTPGRPKPEPPGKEHRSPFTAGRSQATFETSQVQSRLPDWWTVKSSDNQVLHGLETAADVRDNDDKRAWTQQAAMLQQKLNLLEKSCSLPPTDSRCSFKMA